MSIHGASIKLPLPELSQDNMSADAKIQELGIELPPAPTPMGVYKPIVIAGSLAYLSGHGPVPVSYTHLTLPTILLVKISVVAVS